MNYADIFTLVVVGIAAGFINVIAGGGSMLSVPALVLMGVPGPVANGTNRIAIIAQATVAAATFARRGVHNLRLTLVLSACLIPGAIIGAWSGAHIEGEWFNRLLALVMIAVMLTMGLESRIANREHANPEQILQRPLLVYLLMLLLGFYGGIIHIGIGFLLMFILHRVGGLDLITTNMLKMATVIPYSFVALAVFAQEAGIFWAAGAALAIGNAFGGWAGAHVSIKRGERFIRLVFNACIVLLIIRLLF